MRDPQLPFSAPPHLERARATHASARSDFRFVVLMHRTTTYTLLIIAPVKPRSVDASARYMRRVEPESEFRFLFFWGHPKKHNNPPGSCWLALRLISTRVIELAYLSFVSHPPFPV